MREILLNVLKTMPETMGTRILGNNNNYSLSLAVVSSYVNQEEQDRRIYIIL